MAGRDKKDGKAVPFRRLSRLAKFGGLTANVAGNMAVNGAKDMLSGKRPALEDLLLTPRNAAKITHQLANMRGAAMKIGQMMSMDSGDFLPQEFADILAQLRSDADHMPAHQLESVMRAELGEDWRDKFQSFDDTPIAAASIGQVHRAVSLNGEDLALKIQYPGVKESIDSDINNVAGLIKMTGLIPKTLQIDPIIEEARAQLHQEADYAKEANYLTRFGTLLEGHEAYQVPQYFDGLSTDKVLTMSYLAGEPIEDQIHAPQEIRDRIIHDMSALLLSELFDFRLIQTDPNFANYQYNPDSSRIILLDFGASKDISETVSDDYAKLFLALISGESAAILEQFVLMKLLPPNMPFQYLTPIMELIELATEPLSHDRPFDFGENALAHELRDKALALAENRELWYVPPAGLVFIQRKLGGLYLLASRLKARVNIHALIRDALG